MIPELALEKLYSKALKFIGSSPRTKEELRKRLLKYAQNIELTPAEIGIVIDTILERFVEERFIDDARYAREFVMSITASSKPRGLQYIQRFLIKKGVERIIIEKALSEVSSEDQYDSAVQLITKKLTTLKYKDYFDAKKKLWSLLIRRGFSSDVAGRAVDNVLGVK